MKARYKRTFLGDIDTSKYVVINPEYNKYTNSVRRRFHNKHLKAYLKGQERFHFGVDDENNIAWYEVMFTLQPIKDD